MAQNDILMAACATPTDWAWVAQAQAYVRGHGPHVIVRCHGVPQAMSNQGVVCHASSNRTGPGPPEPEPKPEAIPVPRAPLPAERHHRRDRPAPTPTARQMAATARAIPAPAPPSPDVRSA